ncbi:MAG: hypothetical protein IJV07_03420 [Alphaproteobacteria bacterium]|nr:hypothetical protein [Alphaproteobacteria bacterium]
MFTKGLWNHRVLGRPSGRLAVHLHLYYEEQLPMVLAYLNSLSDIPYDLFVTLSRENHTLRQQVLKFNSNAIIWVADNRGYDVGPFIDFLHRIDLNNYAYIMKLHTKNNKSGYCRINGYHIIDSLWGALLWDSLLKDKKRVLRNLAVLEKDSNVGMLGSQFLTTHEKKTYQHVLPLVNQALEKMDFHPVKKVMFVAGTMFLARAFLFQPLLKYQISDFEMTDGNVKDKTLAHAMERVFGALVTCSGYRIKKIRQPGFRVKLWRCNLRHFIWKDKVSARGIRTIKIFKIPVYQSVIRKEEIK